jgi:hypothetical protein
VHREPVAHHACLVLGARHQHAPPVQRAGLPPRQPRALLDGVPDRDDQRAVEVRALAGQRPERGLHGLLRGERAAGGHGDRRRRREAVRGQARDDVGQVSGGGVQHERAGDRGERRPVHTRTHVGLDVRRAERDAGVGRHGGARCDAGDDVERQARGGDGEGLGHDGVGRQRIAADQPHDRPARGRLDDQACRDVGGLADRRPDLGAVRHQGEHTVGYVGVGDHQRG